MFFSIAKIASRCYHNDVTVPDFSDYRKESTKDSTEPSSNELSILQ